MNSEFWKHCLALLSVCWITFGLTGCNQDAEVPTAGDGPKQAAAENSSAEKKDDTEAKPEGTKESEELKDDSTESESGSNLE